MKAKNPKATKSKDRSSEGVERSPQHWKEEGNKLIHAGLYTAAKMAYENGIAAYDTETAPSCIQALHSNISLVCQKMKLWDEAERHCTLAMEYCVPTTPKIYFRRAVSREHLYEEMRRTHDNDDNDNKRGSLLLKGAISDLNLCMRLLEAEAQKSARTPIKSSATATAAGEQDDDDNARNSNHNEQKKAMAAQQIKPARVALLRVQKLWKEYQMQQQQQVEIIDDDGDEGVLSSSIIGSSRSQGSTQIDDADKQQEVDQQQHKEEEVDVTSVSAGTYNATPSVKSKSITSTPTTTTPRSLPSLSQQQNIIRQLLEQSAAPSEGEAFYLVSYPWWKRFCEYTMFDRFDLLPPGGEKPSKCMYKALIQAAKKSCGNAADSSSDDDDTSSSESESNGEEVQSRRPQPLDASSLVMCTEDGLIQLKPNLVRGYHYEVIPREAYAALCEWYGVTGSRIFRRTSVVNGAVKLKLYPKHYSILQNNYDDEAEKKGEEDIDRDVWRCSACRSIATRFCSKCENVYYCSVRCQESHWKYHRSKCQKAKIGERRQQNELALGFWGSCGLGNLGNTCFMNSSLQCLSHAYPLTKYFLTNEFLRDINESNPLGTKGNLARAYDATMKELYWSNQSYIKPTQLKRSIALFQPRFAGYSQEDAPEFLAYLLDGLHEDLNRIKSKPYITLPDAEKYPNVRIAGAEAREADRHRNCSVLRDNFYGQYQSTCVCPICKQVSVTFDPFNVMNVHLPIEVTRTIHIAVVQKNAGDVWGIDPVRYGVKVSSTSSMENLIDGLSELCGISAENLALCDVHEFRICDIYIDMDESVSKIHNNDLLVAYEVEDHSNTVSTIVTHNAFNNGRIFPIGVPLYCTFRPEMTCLQVREFLWCQVRRMVQGQGDEDVNSLKLVIRVVNNKGRAVAISDNARGKQEMDSKLTNVDPSLLPLSSSITLKDLLGEDCVDHYFFLHIEWTDDPWKGIFDNDAMVRCTNHSSLDANAYGLSLDQCLSNFTKSERLDEHNKYYCSKCETHVRAMKTIKLCHLPNILVIHLKRFEFKSSFRRYKLDTFIDCPINGLDMRKHCRLSKGKEFNDIIIDEIPAVYDLFGVTNHYGRMGFGHYTASCRQWDDSGMGEDWSLFDDSNVTEIDESNVITPAAYVLFYRRRIFA